MILGIKVIDRPRSIVVALLLAVLVVLGFLWVFNGNAAVDRAPNPEDDCRDGIDPFCPPIPIEPDPPDPPDPCANVICGVGWLSRPCACCSTPCYPEN